MDHRYLQWALPYYESTPHVGVLLMALPRMSIQTRKCVLAFTRIRQPISRRSRFSKVFADDLSTPLSFCISQTTQVHHTTLRTVLSNLEAFADDPITMAFISTCTRSAPYEDYGSVEEVRQKTIEKEIQAALSAPWNAPLNYEPIFSPDRSARYQRMFPNLPLDPEVHTNLHRSFLQARKFLEGAILFPHMSAKSIGRDSRERASYSLATGTSYLLSIQEVHSTADCERWYAETGDKFTGVVEVRSAWKYNDLKPRVYYAQGPDCYYASRYIQSVFNTILDCFEVVHRHNRFEPPPDPRMDFQDRLATYDYSSFTSSLPEIKRFTAELSRFFRGTSVVLLDTYEGCVGQDLGELLAVYTEQCNEWAEFDAGRILDLEGSFVFHHNTGMLGVPGNISSCTLLHGIHITVACGVGVSRCVGDDAVVTVPEGRHRDKWETFVNQIQNLGVVAEEKFTHWDWDCDPELEGWCYIKKPMVRCEGRIITGISLVWPTIHNLIPLRDNYHTSPTPSPSSIIKTFISQWSRLLTRIEVLDIVPTDTARILMRIFQNKAYNILNLGRGGCPFIQHLGKHLMCPRRLSEDEFGTGWKTITLDHLKGGDQVITVPLYAVKESFVGRQGESFLHDGSRVLGLLEKLGYVHREPVKEVYRVDEVLSPKFLEQLVSLDYPFSYRYTVDHDFPSWADDVSSLEHMSPHERLSVIRHR